MKTNYRVASIILMIFMLSYSFSTGADFTEAAFTSLGWEKKEPIKLLSSAGEITGQLYEKKINGRDTRAIALPERNLIWLGDVNPHTVLLDDGIVGFGWINPAKVIFLDYNVKVNTDDDVKNALTQGEDRFNKGIQDVQEIRHYKGVFGLVSVSNEELKGTTLDRTTTLTIQKLRFKGDNLEIILQGGGSENIHEIDSNLKYISSSVNGKAIDPKTVEARPIRSRAEYRRYIEEKYGLEKSDPSKTTPPAPGE
jgi:hypothetical protein